jgi:UDP-N-acetylglucosamine:LPS N-acetylglucosamine transferase
MHASKPTVLVVLSGGGFSFETKCLLRDLEEDVTFVYLATQFGGSPGEGGIPSGVSYRVPTFQTVSRRSTAQSLYAFVATFLIALFVVKSRKVTAILGIGCSHVVPMFLAGRLLRRTNIFVESITRTDRLSNTGKIVDKMRLSDMFIVQWPALQALHSRSRLGIII